MSNILKMKLKQLLLSFELEMGCFVKFVKIYDGGVWPETETVPQTEETINCQQLEEHEVTEHQRTTAINHINLLQ